MRGRARARTCGDRRRTARDRAAPGHNAPRRSATPATRASPRCSPHGASGAHDPPSPPGTVRSARGRTRDPCPRSRDASSARRRSLSEEAARVAPSGPSRCRASRGRSRPRGSRRKRRARALPHGPRELGRPRRAEHDQPRIRQRCAKLEGFGNRDDAERCRTRVERRATAVECAVAVRVGLDDGPELCAAGNAAEDSTLRRNAPRSIRNSERISRAGCAGDRGLQAHAAARAEDRRRRGRAAARPERRPRRGRPLRARRRAVVRVPWRGTLR